MNMVCNNCGEVFAEENAVIVDGSFTAEYWGQPVECPYTTMQCPECGSDDIKKFWGD